MTAPELTPRQRLVLLICCDDYARCRTHAALAGVLAEMIRFVRSEGITIHAFGDRDHHDLGPAAMAATLAAHADDIRADCSPGAVGYDALALAGAFDNPREGRP